MGARPKLGINMGVSTSTANGETVFCILRDGQIEKTLVLSVHLSIIDLVIYHPTALTSSLLNSIDLLS